ncbi:Copia protein [Eumeta japonica]|uniref:Copia protein n=1 Tax=Eumeta variegata TaxID=151549 RepID=A0A4C1XYN8_EUMVA|nr:Copia protein [Eumeta japonica]
MSANYLINVPKLTGRDNYGEWCFAAENFLILEGMKHCVKPDAGVEVKTADDEKTKAKLIMTIDPSLYVHVKSVKSSKELWEKLKQLFDDSGFSRRISLLRNLISIRRENCSSMTSYVTQIIDTAQKLSGTGFEINDQWTGSLLLAGLPDRFSPMIMTIEHSGIPITADSIKTKLLDMDLASHSESEIEGAFAIRSNSPNLKFNRRPNKNLSMAGKSNIDNSNTGQVKTNVKQIQCYRCKQIGHYKNQCTNEKHSPMQKTKDRIQSNAFSAVFLSGNFKRDDWYIDSGASVHLTANESWVMNANGECKNPDDTEQQETDSITNNSESSMDSFQDVNDETYVPTDYEDSDSILKDDGNRSPQCLNKRIRKVPDRYGFSNLCVDNETYVDAAGLSLHDALNGPERTQWESAMSEELQCFKDNDAWELSDPPKDGTVVQCKWVLCKKYDSENKVRFRARLVAKGYSQIEEGFVDADWGANTIDRRSYTGVCFTLSGCVISWETRKQKTVALSSSEAEYMAITEACKEAVYLRNLQIENILNTPDRYQCNETDEDILENINTYMEYAAHTFNLVASKDANAALQITVFETPYKSSIAKHVLSEISIHVIR